MSQRVENIIQKQIIDVVVNTHDNGFDLQKDIDDLCKLELIPQLEKLLDSYNLQGEIIRIDQLIIDVDDLLVSDFQQKFTETVIQKIDQVLQEKLSVVSAKKETVSRQQREIQLLVFYLEKGHLPWWSTVRDSSDWQSFLSDLFSENSNQQNWKILVSVLKKDVVRQRLISFLTDDQFWTLTAILIPEDIKILRKDVGLILKSVSKEKLKSLTVSYKDQVLRSISEEKTESAIAGSISKVLIKELPDFNKTSIRKLNIQKIDHPVLKGFIKNNLIVKDDKISAKAFKKAIIKTDLTSKKDLPERPEVRQQELGENIDSNGIYINNAGLAILAPFLPMFFKNIGIIDSNGVTNAPKAIALLHHIVKGESDYNEFESVFPKILCGIELNEVVEKENVLATEKQMIDELLHSVIEHWAVLKNTSIEGLQTSFLQREGKLIFENNEWNLKVQQTSYDVLLSEIPWNINMIKLSWMKNLLKVEWP